MVQFYKSDKINFNFNKYSRSAFLTEIFIATLGMRPEAITVGYQLWRDHHPHGEIAILHTDSQYSDIAAALTQLRQFLQGTYPRIPQHYHEIRRADGTPLLDILDENTANDYFHSVLIWLAHYRREGYHLHLLIAGGRKAMSIYAMTAASLVMRSGDHVWTVISSNDIVSQTGSYQVLPEQRSKVHLVHLPVLTARIASEQLSPLLDDPETWIAHQRDTRTSFLDVLTTEERHVCEVFQQLDFPDNGRLAQAMHKEKKTVENQLSAVYAKMCGFIQTSHPLDNVRKRQTLIDLLLNRL